MPKTVEAPDKKSIAKLKSITSKSSNLLKSSTKNLADAQKAWSKYATSQGKVEAKTKTKIKV